MAVTVIQKKRQEKVLKADKVSRVFKYELSGQDDAEGVYAATNHGNQGVWIKGAQFTHCTSSGDQWGLF